MVRERVREAGTGPFSPRSLALLTLHFVAFASIAVTPLKAQAADRSSPAIKISECGEINERYSEGENAAPPGTVVPASYIVVSGEERNAKRNEMRSGFECFLRALAECRPARLTLVSGKERVTRTVVPLKDGSCAMRIDSIRPRIMGLITDAPYQDFKTYSAVPSVSLCTFVKLDLWENRLFCDDEVVESELAVRFNPVSTGDCPAEIESNRRPTQREKACIVKAVLSCSKLRAHFQIPLKNYDGKTEMKVSISPKDDPEGSRACRIDLENVVDYGGYQNATYCTDVGELSVALSNSWDEDYLLLTAPPDACGRSSPGDE